MDSNLNRIMAAMSTIALRRSPAPAVAARHPSRAAGAVRADPDGLIGLRALQPGKLPVRRCPTRKRSRSRIRNTDLEIPFLHANWKNQFQFLTNPSSRRRPACAWPSARNASGSCTSLHLSKNCPLRAGSMRLGQVLGFTSARRPRRSGAACTNRSSLANSGCQAASCA